ncbi:MAG TPA: hypothetical protein VFX39_09150 [Gemmatimonadaceae bacterium]|nr:hypothetical protein [Gemmatimonadaceae bacterium]
MQRTTADGSSFEEDREHGGREVGSGGADTVQKTTYVVGQGTDPDAPDPRGPSSNVATGGGVNLGVWIVAAVAVLIALVYGLGLLT